MGRPEFNKDIKEGILQKAETTVEKRRNPTVLKEKENKTKKIVKQ